MTEQRTAPVAYDGPRLTDPAPLARGAQVVITTRRRATIPPAGVPP
jgi:hypothetical protein